MRALLSAVILALSAGWIGCSGSPGPKALPPDAGHEPKQAGLPTWLPPYTAAQKALLEEEAETPVQVRVARVFPDLTRFAYAANHRMEDPAEGLKFMQMVATIVTESPRYYVITPASPDVTNTVAQYGPPGAAEPNAWQTIRRKDDGSGRLVKVKLSAEAKADFDRGAAAAQKRDQTGAVGAYKAAIAKSPDVPALRIALAEVLAKGGDAAGAQAAYEAAIGIDPTIATAHAGLAEIHEQRGDLPKARRSVAEALSYHPSSRRAFDVAEKITRGAASAGRVRPYRVFFDATPTGAVRVAAPGGTPGQMYASCRAVMRYEPEVRATIFEQSEATPYYLSVVEEVVCLEAAIGAYIFERHKNEDAEPDTSVEALFNLAQSEGLLGYSMFEILGQHRPERARTAPPDVHRAVVQYVERHVLGEGQPLPEGVYNAGASSNLLRTRNRRSEILSVQSTLPVSSLASGRSRRFEDTP